MAVDLERSIEQGDDAFPDRLRSGFVVFDQETEFVAAKASHQQAVAAQRSQALADRDEQFIACGVAVNVVDLLEAIEIQHSDHTLPLCLGRARDPVLQIAQKQSPVGKTRQHIRHGEAGILARQAFRLAAAHRQFGPRCDQLGKVLMRIERDADHQGGDHGRDQGDQQEDLAPDECLIDHIGHHRRQMHQQRGLRQMHQAEDAADRGHDQTDRHARALEGTAGRIEQKRIAKIGETDRENRQSGPAQKRLGVRHADFGRVGKKPQPPHHAGGADSHEQSGNQSDNQARRAVRREIHARRRDDDEQQIQQRHLTLEIGVLADQDVRIVRKSPAFRLEPTRIGPSPARDWRV